MQNEETPFTNETAIISGGLGDIGSAVALELAKQGAHVTIGDLRPTAEAKGLSRQVEQCGVRCKYDQVDVVDPKEVKRWVADVEKEINPPTIIIPSAATVTTETMSEISPEQWSRELSVNLDGAFHLAKYATSCLLRHDLAGQVIFVGSWAGERVHAHIPAYSVSKAGLRMLCKCLALELAPHDILVNEIAPGFVDAGLSAQLWEQNPSEREEARSKVPVNRLISAKEVAQKMIQLLLPQNKHMTGSTVLMDGGLSLL